MPEGRLPCCPSGWPEARRPSCWTTHAPAAYAPGHCRRPAATKLRCALARSRTPCERAARGDRTLSRAEGSAAGWGQGEGWGCDRGAAPRRVAIAGRGGRAANLETTASLRSPERGSGAEIRTRHERARVRGRRGGGGRKGGGGGGGVGGGWAILNDLCSPVTHGAASPASTLPTAVALCCADGV